MNGSTSDRREPDKSKNQGDADGAGPLAEAAARKILSAYRAYRSAFDEITERARTRFESRDMDNMRLDTVRRLDLYTERVLSARNDMERLLGSEQRDSRLWFEIRKRYHLLCRDRCDSELALTFYNSVNRKIFETIGIQPDLEFVAPPSPQRDLPLQPSTTFSISAGRLDAKTVRDLLASYGFETPFQDLDGDAGLCAEQIRSATFNDSPDSGPSRIRMIRHPFFRDMGAYLIGSIEHGQAETPLVFVLHNEPDGLRVDALLLQSDQLRILFSFSRDYFHVSASCPACVVRFLKRLMPLKRVAELYIALGYHKHGKTELYRELIAHRQICGDDRFDFSPGQRGMVMIAFNMSQVDLIYKIIRDKFDRPKKTTGRQVMERYDYVFKHDRAGRLLDVQTFENLRVEKCCFTPALLEEIEKEASRSALVNDDHVVLRHVFVERLVTPLDIYVKQAAREQAEAAVVEYGNAIRDLAAVNVFPGDMLIKNFGVTRLGRVVFYDYDELRPLLELNFRKIPRSRYDEEELSAEPWFSVSPNDVFPEEFERFLGLPSDLKNVFLKHHADLILPGFWRETQRRIREGLCAPILPYKPGQRLRPAPSREGPS